MKTSGKRFMAVVIVTTIVGGAGIELVLLRLQPTTNQSYSLVEDGLYVGESVNRPPRGTQAVVNLCGRPDPYQVGPSLWAPLYEAGPDATEEKPTLELLRRVVSFIDVQRRSGRTIYVHCMLGQNRSGAVVTAYPMQEHGMGRVQALSFLQQKRPIVQPDPTLMRLLTEWEGMLKANPSAIPSNQGIK